MSLVAALFHSKPSRQCAAKSRKVQLEISVLGSESRIEHAKAAGKNSLRSKLER